MPHELGLYPGNLGYRIDLDEAESVDHSEKLHALVVWLFFDPNLEWSIIKFMVSEYKYKEDELSLETCFSRKVRYSL